MLELVFHWVFHWFFIDFSLNFHSTREIAARRDPHGERQEEGDFTLELMNFALKMMNFVLKMMNLQERERKKEKPVKAVKNT